MVLRMHMLLVEDDAALSEAITAAASIWMSGGPLQAVGPSKQSPPAFVAVGTLTDGLIHLRRQTFDLVLTDVALGEESGIELVKFARTIEPAPTMIAISGEATAAQAFALAELGVRGFLAKPFDLRELRATLEEVLSKPPEVESRAMAQVGYRHIHAVQDEVKRAMLRRALHQESWNISQAAKRLGVTRAAVQQMIDRFGLPRTRPAD
jgi:two-component system, response regulator RegA